MQHRNPVKPGGEPLHRLGGQRNLRQQHNRRLALAHDLLDRPNVDLRLAAIGHAVQQGHAEPPRLDLPANVLQRPLLIVVET